MTICRTPKDPITVEIMLHYLVWWLGCGSYLDLTICTGIHITSIYCCIYKCIDAILNSEESAYKFQGTSEELDAVVQGFASISSQGAIKGYSVSLHTPFSVVEKDKP